MIRSLVWFILTVIGLTVAAFVFFALVFGATDYLNGALLTREGAYDLGNRVGLAAFVLGPLLGVYVGLSEVWEARRADNSPAWATRVIALVGAAALLVPLLSGVGMPALGAVLHYGGIGKLAFLVFAGVGGSLAYAR